MTEPTEKALDLANAIADALEDVPIEDIARDIDAFVAEAVKAEREACAVAADYYVSPIRSTNVWAAAAEEIAKNIRARGDSPSTAPDPAASVEQGERMRAAVHKGPSRTGVLAKYPEQAEVYTVEIIRAILDGKPNEWFADAGVERPHESSGTHAYGATIIEAALKALETLLAFEDARSKGDGGDDEG
ncbi:MAG: hypothetical protein Q8S13_05010 [Dehalococcoidia bacterium]|nr:hypothetical protein [Dehalococcoidia bacterium]